MSRWILYYLGAPEDAKKFSYKLEFRYPDDDGQQSQNPIVFKSPCSSAPEKDSFNFRDHNSFYFHRNLLDGYCDNAGHLNYRITIYCNVKEEDETISGLLEELSTED